MIPRADKSPTAIDWLESAFFRGVARVLFLFRGKRRMDEDYLKSALSFLLIRPEGLGDIVLTLPAIAFLRRINPTARISMAVRPAFADFVRDTGIVDDVIRLDYPKRSRFSLMMIARFLRQVAGLRHRFDVAWDFRGDPRNAIIGAWSAPVVAGRPAPETSFLLAVEYRGPQSNEVAAQNLAIVSAGLRLSPRVDDYFYGYRFQIVDEVSLSVAQLLAGWKDFFVVHPGASRPSNRWSTPRWRALIVKLLAAGETVVITGAGREEREVIEATLAGLEPNARLLNLLDRTSCTELAGIIELAKAVISPDTGVAHIAYARGVPSVTLFGSDSETVWGHETPINQPVYVNLPCRPCLAFQCPRLDFPMECMERIGVDDVFARLQRVAGTRLRDNVLRR